MSAGAGLVDPRLHLAEIQPGHDRHIELHVTVQSMDDPDELAAGMQLAAGAHGKEIDEPRLAGARGECRDEHEAVAAILALYPVGTHRGDRKVTALVPIEEAAKTTVGIEPGQAAPVDGAAAGDESGGVAITDQAVVGDRRIRRLAGGRFRYACSGPPPHLASGRRRERVAFSGALRPSVPQPVPTPG